MTLTDDERPAEPMDRLRSRFPHALELRFEPGAGAAAPGAYTGRIARQDDLGLCRGFVEHVRHRAASESEAQVLRSAVEGARVALARESGVAPLRQGRRLVPARSAGAAAGGIAGVVTIGLDAVDLAAVDVAAVDGAAVDGAAVDGAAEESPAGERAAG